MFRHSIMATLLVGASLLTGCIGQSVAEAASLDPAQNTSQMNGRILPVEITPIIIGDTISYPRDFIGRVVAGRETQLGFEVSGRIARLDVNVGDRVERGEIIGRVSSERRTLAIQQAEAQREEITARLRAAEESLARVRDLSGRGYATQQELDDALAARDALTANINAIDRQIALNTQDLKDTVLRAPFAGSITVRNADQGAVIMAGQPVITLLSEGGLEAEIGVPPSVVRGLDLNTVVSLQSRGQTVEGTVLRMGREIDTATRTVAVRIALNAIDNGQTALIPGDLISVSIPKVESAQAAKVPLTSLNQSWRGLWSVYVMDGDKDIGPVTRKDVEIIAVDDEHAFIRGTVVNGDRLITSTTDRVVPGQIVRAMGS